MSTAPLVSISGASVRYGRDSVLRDATLEVFSGEVVGIVGANGSGKSTLLRVAVGLLAPDAGRVTLFGQSPTSVDAARRVGAAIDTPALYPWMSGPAALKSLLGLAGEADRGRVAAALEQFDLGGVGRKLILRYSQGMRKRLVLAAAAMRSPDLLVLDEPTNALDPAGRDLVNGWIRDQATAGRGVLMATHRPSEIQLCDRLFRLEDGTLRPVDVAEESQR
ncbi:MAG: ABC transporter ATP-binding protein [Acidimicrobiales bacterium]